MTHNLYPLIYKPGIKRDGTLFQADYCTEGQWVRFQRGFVRKMGGMKGMEYLQAAGFAVTNMTIVPTEGNNNNMFIYIQGDLNGVKRYEITQEFNIVGQPVNIYDPLIGNSIWKTEIVIQANTKKIVFLGSPNSTNINSTGDSTLLSADLYGNNLVAVPLNNLPNLSGLSSLLFTANYLFVFGANGLVQWSNRNDPLDFSQVNNNQIRISNDKVIEAKAIRGGINTPTILFWTLSSVVRAINVNDPLKPDTLNFQLDVLSKTSSILSSRSIVEYDGLFFWPGTNRFFQYNGIVSELSNTMSLSYFFNNLDMTRRQQVFGVKNTQYGEIWWFYPEKAGAPSRTSAAPVGENSRALIYNIRENAWYDTSISRSCGVYSEEFGFMSTYGRTLTNSGMGLTSIWRHEYETFSTAVNAIQEIKPQNAAAPIFSSFTTPTISWAAFNPMRQLTGVNKWMYVVTLEPDFTLLPIVNDLTLTIISRWYAQSEEIESAPFLFTDGQALFEKVDTAFQGRHLTFRFDVSSNFEMGHVMVLLGLGDGQ